MLVRVSLCVLLRSSGEKEEKVEEAALLAAPLTRETESVTMCRYPRRRTRLLDSPKSYVRLKAYFPLSKAIPLRYLQLYIFTVENCKKSRAAENFIYAFVLLSAIDRCWSPFSLHVFKVSRGLALPALRSDVSINQ